MTRGKELGRCFQLSRTATHCALAGLQCLALVACGSRPSRSTLDPALARAVAQERELARELAGQDRKPVPSEAWKFFDLVEQHRYEAATDQFEVLRWQSFNYNPPRAKGVWALLREAFGGGSTTTRPATALNDAFWCPLQETLGIAEIFHDWDPALLRRFANDIINSIPTNSIYFGGTDPGRFAITALTTNFRQGQPFYILTQNALADQRYLDYLRFLYSSHIYIPSAADSQLAFSNYLHDAQQRLKAGKLEPGEDVKIVNNRVSVSGQVAVMRINGLLAKMILTNNPGHEFYVEQSFPLDWMYPYPTPHRLILKLNRQPLTVLPESLTRQDHQYWQHYTARLIGDWLRDDTPVKEVCDFALRVHSKHDLSGFAGDHAFATNSAAQKTFSKLRSSIAGIYAWRYREESGGEKGRMAREADFAFRQALALCPYSPEAVYGYVNLLMQEKRPADALLVAQTWLEVDPNNPQGVQLERQVKRFQ